MDAISAVTTRPSDTLASHHIQQAINCRIQEYPGRVRREQHVGHAFVPVGVAALLREYPTLVAPALTAFCNRDQLDAKALRVMRHFPPEQRVVTAIKFSKAMYAKLQATPYTPDVRTGWNLPLPSQAHHAQHLLGVKIACGFELLVCNAGGVTPGSSPHPKDAPAAEEVTANPRWGRYKKTLTDRGYFREELNGSKLHKELEGNALRYFTDHMLKADPGKDHQSMDTLSAGAMVLKLLPTVNTDIEFFKERQNRLVPADDESWLTITPEMLDEMLESRYGSKESSAATDQQLQSGLQTFLGNTSDLEGVEMPADLQEKLRKLSTMSLPRKKHSQANARKPSHARKASTANSQDRKISSQSVASNASDMSSYSSKIDFNADTFTDALKQMLELGLPDDDYWEGSDDESSGLSSYGDEDSSDGGSRKISSGSQDSASSDKFQSRSSAANGDLRSAMRAMEDELRCTTIADNMRTLDSDDDDDVEGEFDDVESFAPVKVDAKTVQQLVAAYRTEKSGEPGPATTLLSSMRMKPK